MNAFARKANIPEIVLESRRRSRWAACTRSTRLVALSQRARRRDHGPARPAPVRCARVRPRRSGPQTLRAVRRSRLGDAARIGRRRRRGNETARSRTSPSSAWPAVIRRRSNLRELWENLAGGRDCVEEIPADRYERRLQQATADEVPRRLHRRRRQVRLAVLQHLAARGGDDGSAGAAVPRGGLGGDRGRGLYPETLAAGRGSRNVGVFVGAVWADVPDARRRGARAGNHDRAELVPLEHRQPRLVLA